MKNLFLFICSLLYSINAFTINEYKSFNPGNIWKDNNGVHINAHGGGFLFKDSRYYWFGEHKIDGKAGNKALVGVHCYSSTDLYNWTDEGIALRVDTDSLSPISQGCILERPKVIYNKKTDKYVMWFHLELKGQGYAAARSAVAVSDLPTGPFKYLRSLRPNAKKFPYDMTERQRNILDTLDSQHYQKWWTPEWNEAVKNGLFVKRDMQNGQMARDMQLFVDDDGKAYHIYSSEENLTLHIAELNDEYTGHTGKYVRVAPAGHNEAPAIFKADSTYWMITSGCTGWDPNEARMFSATNIFGPWTQHRNPCVGPKSEITFGGQSTFVLKLPGKKNAFIFMADIWKPKHPSDARYIWLPIQFKNGNPVVEWMDSWILDFFDKRTAEK